MFVETFSSNCSIARFDHNCTGCDLMAQNGARKIRLAVNLELSFGDRLALAFGSVPSDDRSVRVRLAL